jgi:O-antigen ligase
MDYFFNSHLRWNLGWDTPNQGGAFLVTLLPWVWVLTTWLVGRAIILGPGLGRIEDLGPSQSGALGTKRTTSADESGPASARPATARIARLLLAAMAIASEVWLTWALVKTYSRGALAGWGAAGLLMLGVCAWRVWRAPQPGSFRGLLLAGGLRLLLLLVCLGFSGGFERVAPEYVGADKSVLNRLDLWKGGLELVAIRPLRGWGWGNAGQSFMNWTQPIGRNEGYKSMVNSYLTVAVEGGLPVFGLAVFLGGLIVAVGAVAGVADPGSNSPLDQDRPALPA